MNELERERERKKWALLERDTKELDMYDRIEQLLSEKRISKRKLSLDLDIPYTTIASMFKRRSMSVDIETIKKISKYLDIDLDFVVSGEIYPETTKFGTTLKQLRINNCITQAELADVSGYSIKEIY